MERFSKNLNAEQKPGNNADCVHSYKFPMRRTLKQGLVTQMGVASPRSYYDFDPLAMEIAGPTPADENS